MATEPERPIEKLLAAAAKKRRDELEKPLELHPADRRLLQGEVARKYAAANRAERDSSQGRTVWWPKLAWLLGTVTVLGVALVLIVPTAHKQNFGTVGS